YVSSQPLKTAKLTFLSSSGSRESRSSESDPGSHAVQSLSPAAESVSSPELPPLLLTPQAERVSREAAARLPSLRIVERTISFLSVIRSGIEISSFQNICDHSRLRKVRRVCGKLSFAAHPPHWLRCILLSAAVDDVRLSDEPHRCAEPIGSVSVTRRV